MRVELRFEREIITFKCFEVNAQGEGFSQGEWGAEAVFGGRRRVARGNEGDQRAANRIREM
jgi:hypothetical protein